MVTFNPADPAFLENPYPFYEMGRQMSPLYLESQGIWLVFGYNDVQAILKDSQAWSSQFAPPAESDAPPPSMLGSDPPRHGRLRSLVSQAFTPRMIEQLAPRIREIASGLVDGMAESGSADLVEALAYPLPVIVIAEILGVPPEDRDRFKSWSDDVVSTLGTGVVPAEDRVLAVDVFEEMRVYFTRMVEERRANPRDDLISGLVAAELEGERLSFDELLQMLILLLVAGNETTTNLIGNCVIEFMNHPDQLQRVLDEPALLPSAIEEVLRFSSPVQATVRRATRENIVAGKTIAPGQRALTWIAAANRDPGVFRDPNVFDVGRSPNRHIAFGHGPHFCLGAPLARLEARIAMETLLAKVTGFRRTDSALLPRVPTFIMRGVRKLPIAFERREAGARA
ncbi:MAG: cytochrome P450 [Dehalococcoidia bacterium]|nr:cytochrome P450 [Dehalococcoidia bacterium]